MAQRAPECFHDEADKGLDELLAVIHRELPGMDTTQLEAAYHFSAEAHADVRRRSGELYITHPIQVAIILAEMQLDQETLAAALLHDVVEDTDTTIDDIGKQFGPRVASLVEGVTKLSRIPWTSDIGDEEHALREKERQAESLRKMFLAMVDDLRVVLIKLADRLHNMRTLEHVPVEKQQRTSLETMEIYAPLANRLGISHLRSELEDLAFRYLDPQSFFAIERALERRGSDREAYLKQVQSELASALADAGVPAQIEGRQKHIYSIWQKMQRKDASFDEIYDVLGIRVMVSEKKDCYAALGVIHSMWHPVPGEFDDYIATPKQSKIGRAHV